MQVTEQVPINTNFSTTPQPSLLRLVLSAAALAAVRPTLLPGLRPRVMPGPGVVFRVTPYWQLLR